MKTNTTELSSCIYTGLLQTDANTPDWIRSHIRKYNERFETHGLSTLRVYFNSQAQLKPQSLRNLAFGFKKSVKNTIPDLYQFDFNSRFIIDSFFKEYQNLKALTTQKRIPTESEIIRLINTAGIRTSLIVSLLYQTGLRASEACNINLNKIYPDTKDPDSCEIHVVRKGGCEESLIIRKDLICRIKEVFHGKKFLLETQRGNQYKRYGIYCLITKGSINNLGFSFSPHTLRHAFATHMVSKLPDRIEAIARQGGWKSPAVLLSTYVHQDKLTGADLPNLRPAM